MASLIIDTWARHQAAGTLSALLREIEVLREAQLGEPFAPLHWIGERSVGAERDGEHVTSAADDRWELGSLPPLTAEDVVATMTVAGARPWSTSDDEARRDVMARLTEELEAALPRLAAMIMVSVGKIPEDAVREVDQALQILHDFLAGSFSVTARGSVRLSVTPFEAPLAWPVALFGAAVAHGDASVLAPSPHGGALATELARLALSAGASTGSISVLQGVRGSLDRLASQRFDALDVVGTDQDVATFASVLPRCSGLRRGSGRSVVIAPSGVDVEQAAALVSRAAFGFAGQYAGSAGVLMIQNAVKDELMNALLMQTMSLVIDRPWAPDVSYGPLINRGALSAYLALADSAEECGFLLCGGEAIPDDDLAHGAYVQPMIVDSLEKGHPLFTNRHRVPFLTLGTFDHPAEIREWIGTEQRSSVTRLSGNDPGVHRGAEQLPCDLILEHEARPHALVAAKTLWLNTQ